MNRKGFAPVVVIFAVLALAVMGGIAYVHYVYLPKMAAQNNNSAQTAATATISSSTTPTSMKHATSTVRTATSGSKNCGNNVNCLIAAATDNCSLASGAYAFKYSADQQDNQTSGVSLADAGPHIYLKR